MYITRLIFCFSWKDPMKIGISNSLFPLMTVTSYIGLGFDNLTILLQVFTSLFNRISFKSFGTFFGHLYNTLH